MSAIPDAPKKPDPDRDEEAEEYSAELEQERQQLLIESKKRTSEIRQQALKGDPEAQFQLFLRSETRAEKWKWLCLAAHQGHAVAQGWMGDEHREDRQTLVFVVPDLVQAYIWTTLAKDNGHKWARLWLQDLAQDMTPAEVAEAERLVRQWKPDPALCEIEAAQK